MKQYLLSIIIPTRNRQYYAFQAVKQIINLYGDSVEIIVQDNSDDSSLRDKVYSINKNVIYNYKGGGFLL